MSKRLVSRGETIGLQASNMDTLIGAKIRGTGWTTEEGSKKGYRRKGLTSVPVPAHE